MYRVGLIGLGNIAARYSKPDEPFPYSHAGGIRLTEGVELVAGADPNETQRREVGAEWGIQGLYPSAADMLAAEKLDVAAVCAKGPLHYELALQVIEAGVPVLFLEKPAGCSLNEVDAVVRAAKERGTRVIVSHTRHWGPHMLELARRIREGLVGEVLSVTSYCPGGILGFAVHNVDMLCQFAGYDPVGVFARTTASADSVPDGYEPEVHVNAAMARFAGGVNGFLVGDNGKRPSFAVEVMGSDGFARIGFYTPPEIFDADAKPVELAIPENKSPFQVAYEQIVAYLDGGDPPDCGPDQFVPVNELAFGMIESGARDEYITLPNARRVRKIYCMG